MADEKKEEVPHNKTRKAEWLLRAILVLFGGTGSIAGYYGYQEFLERKPLYDTFQTKPEGAAIQTSVEGLRSTMNSNQIVTVQLLSEIRAGQDSNYREIRKMFVDQQAVIQQNKLDIANLKFITGLKK